jgi:hypothetical protein
MGIFIIPKLTILLGANQRSWGMKQKEPVHL